MKSGKSITELAQHVDEMRSRSIDYRLPGSMLEMGTDLVLRTKRSMPVREHLDITPNRMMHTQLAERLGIPSRYYQKMQQETPELLARNVNEWLVRGNGEKRFIRTYRNEGSTPLTGRAFLGSTYRPLDNYDLVTALVPHLMTAGVSIESSEVTESRLYIQAVAKQFKSRVVYPGTHDRIDDVLNIGLVASNSEVGGGALTIRALVYRQVCTNGLVISEDLPGFKQVHIGRAKDDEADKHLSDQSRKLRDAAVWSSAQDVIKAALSQATLDNVTERINRTAGVKVENPEKALEIVAEKFGIVEDERAQIMRNLISGGIGSTQWGLINAVTALANEVPNYDRAVELEEIGGKMLGLHASAFGSN